MATSSSDHPQVLLFDIGGVCVVSPFQAILDYEKSNNIPLGYINHCISASAPNGAWQRLERGEIPLDATFFTLFASDLSHEARWRAYHARAPAAAPSPAPAPPVPAIDVEWLYWEMMRIAREPDPHMWPALRRLRRAADTTHRGRLVLGALSNTSIFPAGHPFNDAAGTPEGRRIAALKAVFDVFVSSAHVGMRKPDEGIYRYALVRLHEFVKLGGLGGGVRAGDVVFLDDIGGNLRTAKRLGMRTVKVQLGRADLAVEELERITGLNLKGEEEGEDKARL